MEFYEWYKHRHGENTHSSHSHEFRVCWNAAQKATAERCAEIAESYDYYGTNIAKNIRKEFGGEG